MPDHSSFHPVYCLSFSSYSVRTEAGMFSASMACLESHLRFSIRLRMLAMRSLSTPISVPIALPISVPAVRGIPSRHSCRPAAGLCRSQRGISLSTLQRSMIKSGALLKQIRICHRVRRRRQALLRRGVSFPPPEAAWRAPLPASFPGSAFPDSRQSPPGGKAFPYPRPRLR